MRDAIKLSTNKREGCPSKESFGLHLGRAPHELLDVLEHCSWLCVDVSVFVVLKRAVLGVVGGLHPLTQVLHDLLELIDRLGVLSVRMGWIV